MNTRTLFINLLNLNHTSSHILASAIISKEGLVVTSGLPQGLDEERTGAMTAGLFSIASRAAGAVSGGTLERIALKGSENYVLMTGLGEVGILAVIAKPEAMVDLIFFKMQRSAEKLRPLYNALYGSPETKTRHQPGQFLSNRDVKAA